MQYIINTPSGQNIMITPHSNFDSSVQHVRWRNKLDFLIKSFHLVRSTSELYILPVHGGGGGDDFEWDMVAGVKSADSSISEIDNFLGFSPKRMSRVFKELNLRQKKF